MNPLNTALRRNRSKLLLLVMCFALVLYALFQVAPVLIGTMPPCDIGTVGQASIIPAQRLGIETGEIFAAAYLSDALTVRESPDGASQDEYIDLYAPAAAGLCQARAPAGYNILTHAASPHGYNISILALSLGGNAPPPTTRRGA